MPPKDLLFNIALAILRFLYFYNEDYDNFFFRIHLASDFLFFFLDEGRWDILIKYSMSLGIISLIGYRCYRYNFKLFI